MRLGLGLAVNERRPRGEAPWWHPGALLEADFSGGRFRSGGVDRANEATWLAAIGGVRNGSAVLIGPQILSGAPELIQNGDFSGGVTGWTAQSGGSIAVASGECTLTGNGGNSPSVSQSLAMAVGHAYRLRARTKKGASNTITPTVAVSNLAALSGNQHWSFGAVAGQTFLEVVREFSPTSTTMYAGVRAIANPANGTVVLDDVSAKEVVPCAGFQPGGLTLLVSATAGVTGTAQILAQADDNALAEAVPMERNVVRLTRGTDGHLRLVVSMQTSPGTWGEQASLDLGALNDGDSFVALISVSAEGARGMLLGQSPVASGALAMPGLAVLRLGRGHAGSAWGGTIGQVTLWPGALDETGFLAIAAAG